MKLVIGLGNPDPQHESIRHNVGFRVVDRLAAKFGWNWVDMKLVIGLGNPGAQYERTRHNVGFRVVDKLAAKLGWKWTGRRSRAVLASGTIGSEKVVLVKPLTFMNLSGESVGELVRWYNVPPEDVLVVYDELDLPVGRVRLRLGGSAGGHNGMENIIRHLHTNLFPRLRVGIGHPSNSRISGAGHVLSAPTGDERILLETGEDRAVEAVEMVIAQGVEATMNLVNADPEAQQKAAERRRLQLERREKRRMRQVHGVILDVDGTLVNSNDAHAHAWVEAMHENGYDVSFEKVRPLIGMGGDKVLPEVLGIQKDSEEGKKISQRRKEIFMKQYLPTLQPFPCAMELLQRMHNDGLKLAIATSAEPDELQALLGVIGPHASDLFEKETSSKDASKSKPDPDIMHASLQRTGFSAEHVLMIGDTAYDIESAAKVNVKTIALRSGGWSDKDLAQAIAIYTDTADLLAHYDTSPLGVRREK
jgi:aminoacyl-tRNA hydrolase